MKELLTLFKWELEDIYRFPVFEVVVSIIVALMLAYGNPGFQLYNMTLPDHAPLLLRHVSTILDVIYPFVILFAAVLLVASIAGGLEHGKTRLLLSYPVSRGRLLFVQFSSTYAIFVGLLVVVSGLLIALMSPMLLLQPASWLLFAGIALYTLFILSVVAVISILLRSTKTSTLAAVFFILVLTLLVNPAIMRHFPGFFTSVVTTYMELFWDIGYSPMITIPFDQVLLAHSLVTILALVILTVYYLRFLEV